MPTKSQGGLPPIGGSMKQSEKPVEFAKGGKTHMFGGQQAGTQKPGVSRHSVAGGDQGASVPDGGDTSVKGDKFASGGSTKMFGYQGSVPASGGMTSAR